MPGMEPSEKYFERELKKREADIQLLEVKLKQAEKAAKYWKEKFEAVSETCNRLMVQNGYTRT